MTNELLPTCLICEKTFTNEGMKPSRMIDHWKAKRPGKANKDVAYLRDLKVKFEIRPPLEEHYSNHAEMKLKKDLLHLTKVQSSMQNVENRTILVKLLLYQQ